MTFKVGRRLWDTGGALHGHCWVISLPGCRGWPQKIPATDAGGHVCLCSLEGQTGIGWCSPSERTPNDSNTLLKIVCVQVKGIVLVLGPSGTFSSPPPHFVLFCSRWVDLPWLFSVTKCQSKSCYVQRHLAGEKKKSFVRSKSLGSLMRIFTLANWVRRALSQACWSDG